MDGGASKASQVRAALDHPIVDADGHFVELGPVLEEATAGLTAIRGLRIIGTAAQKAAVISFILEGIHPHDLGTILDSEGVAVRTGHHCAMPVMEFFGVPATARASFACYNTREDVQRLIEALHKAREVFG